MAIEGNNFSRECAELRDDLVDSFDYEFKKEIRGQIYASTVRTYLLSEKYKELLNKMKDKDSRAKFDTIKVIDYMIANGLVAESDAEKMESAILAILDSIEDAQMVIEDPEM